MRLETALILVTAFALSGSASAKERFTQAQVKRGAYLTRIMGCNDCHTPWKMGPNGPGPDMALQLSGHPASMALPPAPSTVMPWAVVGTATMTAWSGPWGTSFAANLTPDQVTGIGAWTSKNFIETIRNGKHLGAGRPILPPMPYMNLQGATDQDLTAIFAYLMSLPAIQNRVPDPIHPAGAAVPKQ